MFILCSEWIPVFYRAEIQLLYTLRAFFKKKNLTFAEISDVKYLHIYDRIYLYKCETGSSGTCTTVKKQGS